MRSLARRRAVALTSALLAAAMAVPAGASAAPEEVPDRGPVASEPMRRGSLIVTPAADEQPSPKRTIDGDDADWRSESSRIGGTSRFDAGEHVYADFVHDAWGADDGEDARRLQLTGALAEAESRTTRLDALSQALGAQFGAPRPVGAGEAFGDVLANDVADVTSVRWATTGGDALDLLVEVSNLTDASELAVLVLADTDGVAAEGPTDIDVAGLTTERFDQAVLVTDGRVDTVDLATGRLQPSTDEAVVVAEGWENRLEARLSADLLAPDGTLRAAVVAGRWDGETFTPANVAYRPDEPVAGMYNDQRQALALHEGTVDRFVAEIALADLVAGRTESVRPGPGYHERTFESDPGISVEVREDLDDIYEDTVWQRYALFVPSDHDPALAEQATFWMHYRGGKSHSGGAWSPRLFTQLGEEVGGIVVTPHGRGERRWYEGSSHQDFWEVYEDLHATFQIDPQRRYLSGYSMGGHGSPMMAMLYPDLFAGAYLQAAAIGRDLFDVSVNAEHVPFWFDVSAQDALVEVNQDMALTLRDHGYRYVANTFTAGEHYTQAILDEWAAGARYLQQHEAPENPRTVTYRVVPALIDTINHGRGEPTSRTFSPDGAWWVDGILVADGAEHGTVSAVARTLPGEDVAPALDLGDVQPGDYSVPSVRHGQRWETSEAAIEPLVVVDLAGVSSATFDVARWNVEGHQLVEVPVTSDGDAQVTLAGIPEGYVVTVNGSSVEREGDTAVVTIPHGGANLTLELDPSASVVVATVDAPDRDAAGGADAPLPATGGGHAAAGLGLFAGAVALLRLRRI